MLTVLKAVNENDDFIPEDQITISYDVECTVDVAVDAVSVCE
jgi:hypothetical protein